MATELVKLKGKASWVLSNKTNQWGKWAHKFHPDNTSLEIIRELQAQGVKNVLKKDDEGYFTNFSRPSERERQGKIEYLEPPEVTNSDGSKFEGIVGDGSDVTTILEVYTHKTPGGGSAKAARWYGMIVENSVPYVHQKEEKTFNRF